MRALTVVVALGLALTGAGVARGQSADPLLYHSGLADPPSQGPGIPAAGPTPPGLNGYRLAPLTEADFTPLSGDPLLDEPCFPAPGCYAAVDVTALAPHFKNRIFGPVVFDPTFTGIVHVPGAPLDWTAAPRLELGYRLPRGYGEFLLSYKSVVSEGSETLGPKDGNAWLHSRLNVNQVNFDYANYHALAPGWDMRWRVGVQLDAAFYDTRALQPLDLGDGTTLLDGQRVATNFVGAGPHAGLEIWRQLRWVPGLALYLDFEGAAPLGELRNSFEQVFFEPGVGALGAATRRRTTQALGILGFEAGVSWSPPGWRSTRFTLGYHLDQWYSLGRDDDTGSMGSLTEHGIFFRLQFNF
jgi:hypothetical protein